MEQRIESHIITAAGQSDEDFYCYANKKKKKRSYFKHGFINGEDQQVTSLQAMNQQTNQS